MENQDRGAAPVDWQLEAWNKSLKSLHVAVDMAFFGHSLIHFGNWDTYFPDMRVVNLGVAGQNIDGMLGRVRQLRHVGPRRVFVMAGTNTLGWFPMEEVQRKYARLLLTIRDLVPEAELYAHDVLPTRDERPGFEAFIRCTRRDIEEFNGYIGRLCADNGIGFIPVAHLYADGTGQLDRSVTADGVHLKDDRAYCPWVEEIKKRIGYNN